MEDRDQRALDILRDLGAHPATPFFEGGPAGCILDALCKGGIEHRRDDYGNIIAQIDGPDRSQPSIAFVAHMDHPGFEVIETDGERLVAKAMGGVPVASLVHPMPVLLLLPDGRRVPATTSPHSDSAPSSDRRGDRLVYLSLESAADMTPPASVVFDLPDFELDGDTVRMRAVDDLAGCAAILAMLERIIEDVSEANVYGVFTRAEEEGLIGARLVADAGIVPKDAIVVSVESSAVIPGVAQGAGPVIRTGDRATTFDDDAERVLIVARDALRKSDRDFDCQRQLMSGGVCEATAFAARGYSVSGVAFPLGNYHNATTSIPDPDGGVEAEYINVSDFVGGVDLITEAVSSLPKLRDTAAPWAKLAVPDGVRARLKES